MRFPEGASDGALLAFDLGGMPLAAREERRLEPADLGGHLVGEGLRMALAIGADFGQIAVLRRFHRGAQLDVWPPASPLVRGLRHAFPQHH